MKRTERSIKSLEPDGHILLQFVIEVPDSVPMDEDNRFSDTIEAVLYEARGKIVDELKAEYLRHSPNFDISIIDNSKILDIFDRPIFVEEIPNGYCQNWCCRHLPWFVVTTRIGRFKVGRRKSVYHIEWTETTNETQSKDLFPSEDVTKFRRVIHAHSLVDAKRYVQTIMGITQADNVQLRNCPSCGSEELKVADEEHTIYCLNCPLQVEDYTLSIDELKQIWNNLPR